MVKLRLLLISVIVLTILFQSCSSCSKEVGDDAPKYDDPSWVSEKFFKAYLKQDYEKAAHYCDKQSKRTIEYISNNAVKKEQTFIACDSCEEFSDYAHCYCRYLNEEAEEKTEKILLRNFDDVWKVHFEKGGSPVESSPFINTQAEVDVEAPEQLDYLTEKQVEEADQFFTELIGIFNETDIVAGFTTKETVENLYKDIYNNNTTSNSLVIYNDKYSFDADIYFRFNYAQKLESIEINLKKLSMLEYEYYAYFIKKLTDEYGMPYNANDIDHSEFYKYKGLKFYLKSYNQEIEVNCSNMKVYFELTEAL